MVSELDKNANYDVSMLVEYASMCVDDAFGSRREIEEGVEAGKPKRDRSL